jgi:hypothetical protein
MGWLFNDPQEDQTPTWGDVGKSVSVGLDDVVSNLNAAGRYVADYLGAPDIAEEFKAGEQRASRSRELTTGEMTEGGRDRLTADMLSGKFYEAPFWSLALKSARLIPSTATSLIPAGLMANGIRATAAISAMGGTLSLGEVVDDIYSEIDKRDDATLQKEIPIYAGWREQMGEKEARVLLQKELAGSRGLALFVLGAASTAAGPAGMIGRGIKGEAAALTGAGKGRLANIGHGVLEGAITEGAEEGAQERASQGANVQAGFQKDLDWHKILSGTLEGATLGSLMSGGAGALVGGGHTSRPDHTNQQTPGISTAHAERDVARETETTNTPPVVEDGQTRIDPETAAAPTPEVMASSETQDVKSVLDRIFEEYGTVPGVKDPRGTGDPVLVQSRERLLVTHFRHTHTKDLP